MLSVRPPIVSKFANLQVLGAVRLEHQFHALGQDCGSAADITTWKGVAMQDVSCTALRNRLEDQGVVLDDQSHGESGFKGNC